MRTISDDQKQAIEDATNAGFLRNLNPAFIEKDIHVTEALGIIAASGLLTQEAVKVGPGKRAISSVHTRVTFAGGTCLSKAHRVIKRMSEDIDLKVELGPVPAGFALPKALSTARARLKALHNQVLAALEEAGFELSEEPVVRDQRGYCCMTFQYQRQFNDELGALRPHLKLEFVYQETACPAQTLPVGYLMDSLLPEESQPHCSIACITIEQTVGEKVLSLLRRCSQKWDGDEAELDPAIVRHIYDVWQITEHKTPDMEELKASFPALVRKDQADFGSRHPNFQTRPKATLSKALDQVQTDQELKARYEERLRPLVYAEGQHDYDTSLRQFSAIAKVLIDCLPDDPAVDSSPEDAPQSLQE